MRDRADPEFEFADARWLYAEVLGGGGDGRVLRRPEFVVGHAPVVRLGGHLAQDATI